MKQILVIDLDGVIAEGTDKEVYSDEAGWAFEKCTVMEGAKEGLAKLKKEYDLILSTARRETDKKKTHQWLRDNDLVKYFIDIQINKKPFAMLYIDDKGVHFKDWDSLLVEVEDRLTVKKEDVSLAKAKWVDMFDNKKMEELFDVLWHKETIEMLSARVSGYYDFRLGWFYERINWEEDSFYYVKVRDKIVGYFHIWKYKEEHFIAYAINPNYQGKGIATKGVGILKEKIDITRIRANVKSNNEPSINFLLKNGFKVFGVDKEAYGNDISRVKLELILE